VHVSMLEDLDVWGRLGSLLAIENMDTRKEHGRTADELERYFAALPEARLCFDIAHAWAVDPSMQEGERILDLLGGRLRHLHISSLDDEQHHISLTAEHEALFAPLLDRCRDVPWILEAAPRHG
jgi:sugar phosphate isomerase/epimerase